MKLLLDENLSDRIVPRLEEFFPGSNHVKALGLTTTDNRTVLESFATDITASILILSPKPRVL